VLIKAILKALQTRGRLQTLTNTDLFVRIRLLGRPSTLLFVKDIRLQSCLTTLLIYEDPVPNYETPSQTGCYGLDNYSWHMALAVTDLTVR
jgi:hypothetical protein